jgi:hypothetical protein
VVGENTHLARLGREVDLDGIVGLVDGLDAGINNQLDGTSRSLVGGVRVSRRVGHGCFIGPSIEMPGVVVPGGEATS